jgi:AcrR family transcriptional regulator
VPASAVATRARIRDCARRLMNEHGFAGVSVRSIAAAVGISHGNLCYHYANVERIVAALVEELASDFDTRLMTMDLSAGPLRLLVDAQRVVFTSMVEYRFFFLDYVAIVRALPELRAQLAAIKQRREQQFIAFLEALRAAGLMQGEPRRGADRTLFAQYDLIADFWISQAEVVFGGPTPEAQRHYEKLAFELLTPQLTEEGLRALRQAQRERS